MFVGSGVEHNIWPIPPENIQNPFFVHHGANFDYHMAIGRKAWLQFPEEHIGVVFDNIKNNQILNAQLYQLPGMGG